jgi:dTDP-4-amino-4,6-dideoxygalactose transaminase
MTVPMLDLVRQYETIRKEMDAAILEIVRSGKYVLGPYVQEFEEKAAEYCGVQHAIGVASGTDALLLSLKALDIGPGDAVILPSFTFFATAGVVHNVGATPVFCDIDPKTFNLDPEYVRRILAEYSELRTSNPEQWTPIKAIIPVHLYGQMADMDELMAISKEYSLAVVEDAAQAIGGEYCGLRATDDGRGPSARKAGSIGHLGCFSFYPTKNLGAYGDGGMITTNSDDLADRVRLLRVHGARPKYFHRLVGINSRLDAIQAGILSVKLRYLDEWSAARAHIADSYGQQLADLEGVITPFRAENRTHIFHQYTIRVPAGKRDALKSHLQQKGIGTMIYYPQPLHLQECFAYLGYREGQLPASELASREALSLPMFPELTEDETSYVVQMVGDFFERAATRP